MENSSPKNKCSIKRILLIFILALLGLLILLGLGAFIWAKNNGPRLVQEWKEQNLDAQVSTSGIGLSLNPFGISVYGLKVQGSTPFEDETLIYADEITLKVLLIDLMKGKITIEEVLFDHTNINLIVNEDGKTNFNIYKGLKDTVVVENTEKVIDSVNKTINLDFNVKIINSSLKFYDKRLPFLINAKSINYEGIGSTGLDSVFTLSSNFKVDSLTLNYNGTAYLENKPVILNIALDWDQNKGISFYFKDILFEVDKLPLNLNGRLSAKKQVYDIDVSLKNDSVPLHDIFTALPATYLRWLEKTKVDGIADYKVNIKGIYDADTLAPSVPSANMHLLLRDGYIANEKVSTPIKNLFIDFDAFIPNGNIDSARFVLDTLCFNVGRDYFAANAKVNGANPDNLYIKLNAKSELSLKQWQESLGLDDFALDGKFTLDASVDGRYQKNAKGVVVQFPECNVKSSITKGYFKMTDRPSPIENINLNVNIIRKNDGNGISFIANDINIDILENYIRGDLQSQFILGSKKHNLNMNLQSSINLTDIRRVIPLDSIGLDDLTGLLTIDAKIKGLYDQKNKILPYGEIDIKLKDGYVKKTDMRYPVTNIQLDSRIVKPETDPLQVFIHPFSFVFNNNPFKLDAEFGNLKDPYYNFKANGLINLEVISVMFADTSKSKAHGTIEVNIAAKGTVSDAKNKAYNKLQNSGSIKLTDVNLKLTELPYAFKIKKGEVSVYHGDLKVDGLSLRYGKSNFELNGTLMNIPNYLLNDETLKGDFRIDSKKLVVADLMALSPSKNLDETNAQAIVAMEDDEENVIVEPSVLILPSNIDFTSKALFKQVVLGEQKLDSCTANLYVKDGKLRIEDTGFNLIGCRMDISASYHGINKNKALFDYHIVANNFDVQRAYKEIPMFHDLVSSAADVYGIISLDYSMKGYLNKNMEPIMNSIEGGGVLTLQDVQIKGMKMFSEVGKKTKKNELDNPSLKRVEIKTSIKDNVITIEPVEFKIAGIKPSFKGQTTFDGQLRLQMRIGMPLGLMAIPISITGTSDNPIVTINKAAEKSDELAGSEYVDYETGDTNLTDSVRVN